METEKIICFASMIVAGLIALLFVLDLALGFFHPSEGGATFYIMDVLFLLGAGFVIWQGIETYREIR